MLKLIRWTVAGLAICGAAAVPAGAQDTSTPMTVRTFTLHSLSPREAATLVSPYVQMHNGGGVYEVAGDIQAITVRDTPQVLARVDSLLRQLDRPRATFVLRFQLVAALDSAHRDPAIAGIDALLRGLFRFSGYALLSEGTSTIEANSHFTLTMSGGGDRYQVSGEVAGLETVDGKSSVRMRVGLTGLGQNERRRLGPGTEQGRDKEVGSGGAFPGDLFSTGVTMPVGETLVLGSAAGGGGAQALILVVRPELVGATKR